MAGESWSEINNGITGLNVGSIAIDPPRTPSTLYAGTLGDGGVFKSDNYAESWREVNFGFLGNSVQAIAIDPKTPTTLYAGTLESGVYKSSNGGGGPGTGLAMD